MKGFIIKFGLSAYLIGAIFYSTLHLLGFQLQNTTRLLQPISILTVSQLQNKYNTSQIVTLENEKGLIQLINNQINFVFN